MNNVSAASFTFITLGGMFPEYRYVERKKKGRRRKKTERERISRPSHTLTWWTLINCLKNTPRLKFTTFLGETKTGEKKAFYIH